jgi:hypothetical protein
VSTVFVAGLGGPDESRRRGGRGSTQGGEGGRFARELGGGRGESFSAITIYSIEMDGETREGVNRPKGTPGKALIGFAILAGLVAVFTVRDYYARPGLEATHFPTAVGDTEYFDLLEEVNRGEEAFRVDGGPYYRLEYNPDERSDQGMKKVGRDDEDRFFVYERVQRPGGKADRDGEEPRRYVKVGAGGLGKSQYLLVGKIVPAAFVRPVAPSAGPEAGDR